MPLLLLIVSFATKTDPPTKQPALELSIDQVSAHSPGGIDGGLAAALAAPDAGPGKDNRISQPGATARPQGADGAPGRRRPGGSPARRGAPSQAPGAVFPGGHAGDGPQLDPAAGPAARAGIPLPRLALVSRRGAGGHSPGHRGLPPGAAGERRRPPGRRPGLVRLLAGNRHPGRRGSPGPG